jgi:short-subunit dehydrogenase
VQRVELAETGVWVSLVEPGPIATEFSRNAVGTGADGMRMEGSRFAGLYRHELAQRAKERKPKPFTLPPEAVARAILHAVESRHPRRRYKVTLPALAGAWCSRLLPHAWLDALLIRELRDRKKAAGISRLR